jgi:hypothetical protein
MRLYFIYFAILCCWYSTVNAVENCIDWHENQQLSWSDFQGAVSETSPFAAMTHWYIYYRWKDNKIIAESCFETDKSWVREGKQTDYLLRHEQLHSDIAQLQIRLFKQKLEAVTSKVQVKQVFDQVLNAAKQMQVQYDTETKHSADKVAQQRWSRAIASQLDKLDNYGFDTLITIKTQSSPHEPEQVLNITGVWQTNFGTLQLKQRGKTVSGTYDYVNSKAVQIDGKISGILSSRVLTLTWYQNSELGSARLTFAADGASFEGTWQSDGEKGNSGTWHGTKE